MQPYESIAKIELNLGNTCNIKCRTCHASISSTWMKEEYDLNHSTNTTFKIYADAMKKYHKTYDEESPFWEDLKQNLSTIRQFDFYGGEPLLSKKMWEILKICVDKGYAKDIELHYNTNGTIWPKETELWKNFKSVNLSFSIDGVNERFEYMRFPANWKEVFENMQTARQFAIDNKNTSLSWCITISSINVYYLPETIGEYYKHFSDFGIYLNLVHGPLHFNVSKIHPEVKKHVVEQLNSISKEYTQVWYQIPGIIGFIENGNFDSNLWKNLFKILTTHDEYRDQSFENTFPEYAQVIKSLENVNE
jgi:MoaA/NifB/PqqE/SkfB family radical SAM enzyme